MKAISLWQPWATLIALGHKRFETRSWPTKYRGTLAIHATKRMPDDVLDLVMEIDGFLPRGEDLVTSIERLPRGAVVAVCELVDVFRMNDDVIERQTKLELAVGDWRFGRFAWELANVQPLATPIPARGAQGLWEWTPPTPAEFPLFAGGNA